MITLAGYQENIASTVTPEWFKAERYDFCENAALLLKDRKSVSFFKKLFTLLSRH